MNIIYKAMDYCSAVAELVINGNHIEFYHRNSCAVMPQAYISIDSRYSYKVVTIGMEKSMIKNAITNDGELSFQTICLRESKALDSENSE